MTTPVLTATEDWPVTRAAELMVRYGFTALPVVDERGLLVGIVSEADVLVDPLDGHGAARPRTVGGVMATEVLTVPEHADVAMLTHRMAESGLRAVPVVDGRRLVGIVTRRDLLRAEQHR